MKVVCIATIAGALLATPAGAQTISLHPGETVTVRFENGVPVVDHSGSAAPITKYEAYVVWRAQNADVPPGAKTVPPVFLRQGEGPPDPPKPLSDRVQLTLRRVPGPASGSPDQSVLMIANGYAAKFGYRAVMHAKGQTAPTDVCEVPPNLEGLEHWPYVIDEIEISALRLDTQVAAIRCE